MNAISVPITWDGLDLNLPAEDTAGVLRVVEDVSGWYDTPAYDGHDSALVLTDGAVRGPKVAAARDVTVTGVALGSREALAVFRDDLVMRAAAVTAAQLEIPDGAGRSMAAAVRADSDALKHTFTGPTMFRYQLTLTATDPRLYGPWQSALLSNFAGGSTGWTYKRPRTWNATCTAVPAAAPFGWSISMLAFRHAAAGWSTYHFGYGDRASGSADGVISANWDHRALDAGDFGIVSVLGTLPLGAVTVTDTQGNAWQPVTTATSAQVDQRIFTCPAAKALGAADTISVHTANAAQLRLDCWGFKGMGPYAKAGSATGNSTAPTVTLALTDPSADLIAIIARGDSTWPKDPPAPWARTRLTAANTNPLSTIPYTANLTAPGATWPATVTAGLGSAANWASALLAFATGSAVSSYQFGFVNPVASRSFTIPANFGHAAIDAGDTGLLIITTNAATTATVADSKGNAWQRVALSTGQGVQQHVFTAPSAKALAAADTITIATTETVTGSAAAYGLKGLGGFLAAATAAGNSPAPRAVLGVPVQTANVIALSSAVVPFTASPAGWARIGANSGNGTWSVLDWSALTAGDAAWAALPATRAYTRKYAQAAIPNQATLTNIGNVPAPVQALYTGNLSQSRLMDGSTGRLINVAALADQMQIIVDTGTLGAWAEGAQTRASYILPGSQQLFIPPRGSVPWSLYAAGAGSVLLQWRPAWH